MKKSLHPVPPVKEALRCGYASMSAQKILEGVWIMINGHLDQFLDTGWYSEATLYYNGYVYWCEAQCNTTTNITTFFVDKWAAENEDNSYYHSIVEEDGTVKWERVFEINDKDLELIKKYFLEASIFDGKSFWQIEKEIVWLEEGAPI